MSTGFKWRWEIFEYDFPWPRIDILVRFYFFIQLFKYPMKKFYSVEFENLVNSLFNKWVKNEFIVLYT